ncbi:MAG: DUF429 domain-containing protein [Chloroflexi bacterium]|nr:DUF429 domain-containing protein [Chloroflexota bacterium]
MTPDLELQTTIVNRDDELQRFILEWPQALVAIDAPLNWPREGYNRQVEYQLRRAGIPVFPARFIEKLTQRGIALSQSLKAQDYEVIEVYPGGAQDVLGIPRKKESPELLGKGLMALGLHGILTKEKITGHELDAITCALVGKFYLGGDFAPYRRPQ